MNDWPSLGEELARKSYEITERLIQRTKTREITKKELVTSLESICLITQGLIPNEDWNNLYNVLGRLK